MPSQSSLLVKNTERVVRLLAACNTYGKRALVILKIKVLRKRATRWRPFEIEIGLC